MNAELPPRLWSLLLARPTHAAAPADAVPAEMAPAADAATARDGAEKRARKRGEPAAPAPTKG